MAGKKKEMSFEEAVKALEQTVKNMESGDLGLDELLAGFEQGIGLLRLCEKKLAQAEGRIEVLTKAEIAASNRAAAAKSDAADDGFEDIEDIEDLEAPPEDEPKLPF